MRETIGDKSYNQMTMWLCDLSSKGPDQVSADDMMVQEFLQESNSMTEVGLARLKEHIKEGQLAVLFAHSHFSVVTNTNGVRESHFPDDLNRAKN